MLIGVKYCGGCNPTYERGAIVKRAKQDYRDVRFEPYSVNESFDLVLVVCGCMQGCFTFTCRNSIHGVIFIRSEKEYQNFRDFMEKHEY